MIVSPAITAAPKYSITVIPSTTVLNAAMHATTTIHGILKTVAMVVIRLQVEIATTWVVIISFVVNISVIVQSVHLTIYRVIAASIATT